MDGRLLDCLDRGLPASLGVAGVIGVVLSKTRDCCDMERCGVVARLNLGGDGTGVLPVCGVSGRDLK